MGTFELPLSKSLVAQFLMTRTMSKKKRAVKKKSFYKRNKNAIYATMQLILKLEILICKLYALHGLHDCMDCLCFIPEVYEVFKRVSRL